MDKKEWDKLNQEEKDIVESICAFVKDETMQELLKARLVQDKELLPHIKAELRNARKDPEVNNLTVYDILASQGEEAAYKNGYANEETMPKSKALIILEKALRRQAISKMPLQPSYEISSISVANDIITNYMQDRAVIGFGEFDMHPLRKPQQGLTICAKISIANDKEEIYAGLENLTETDRAVIDRLYTLKKNAELKNIPCLVDGYIIASIMPGGASRISDTDAKMYNQIIEKLRHVYIKCDYTAEMEARGFDIPEGTKYELDDFCISALGMTEYRTRKRDKAGNQIIKKGFVLRDIPLPYVRAEQTNQVIKTDAEDYNIRETMPDGSGALCITESNIKMSSTRRDIVNYLVRRIYNMKHDYKQAKEAYRKYEERRKKANAEGKSSADLEKKEINDFFTQTHAISIDTLYQTCGVEVSEDPKTRKVQESRYRAFFKDALNYWKARGLIHDYKIVTGKAASIKIMFM